MHVRVPQLGHKLPELYVYLFGRCGAADESLGSQRDLNLMNSHRALSSTAAAAADASDDDNDNNNHSNLFARRSHCDSYARRNRPAPPSVAALAECRYLSQPHSRPVRRSNASTLLRSAWRAARLEWAHLRAPLPPPPPPQP